MLLFNTNLASAATTSSISLLWALGRPELAVVALRLRPSWTSLGAAPPAGPLKEPLAGIIARGGVVEFKAAVESVQCHGAHSLLFLAHGAMTIVWLRNFVLLPCVRHNASLVHEGRHDVVMRDSAAAERRFAHRALVGDDRSPSNVSSTMTRPPREAPIRHKRGPTREPRLVILNAASERLGRVGRRRCAAGTAAERLLLRPRCPCARQLGGAHKAPRCSGWSPSRR